MAKEPSDSTDAAERPSLRERMAATFLRPPDLSPKDDQKQRPATDAELKAKITQLDSMERKLGYWAGAIGAVVAIVATYPYISNPKKSILLTQALGHNHTCPKDYSVRRINGTLQCASELVHPRTDWILSLVVLLVFSLGMLVATRFNRRSALGFASLMTGLAFTTVLSELGWGLLALPFLFFGGWLIVRAYRAQKYGTTSAKEAAAASAEKRAEKKAARGGTAPPTKSRSTTTKSSTGGSSRSSPAASKRYTPKAPPKKKTTRS
jgi:hypothetical protein